MASGEISSRRWVSRWSELQSDELLDLIVKKLTRASDYLRFRCVCKSWRSVAKPTNLPPHLPLLMLHDYSDARRRYVLSLPSREIRAITIRDLANKVAIASSRGWLLLLDLAPAGGRLFLLNPLTGTQIQLPPTDGFFHMSGFEFSPERQKFVSIRYPNKRSVRYSAIFPWQAYLLLSPNLKPRDSIVVIAGCYSHSSKIAFCRLGDESWTEITTGLVSMPVSVVHHEGSLYMTDTRSNASFCKIASPSNLDLVHFPGFDHRKCDIFFVTTSTQLLLFVRYHRVALIPRNADFDDEHFNRCFAIFEFKEGNVPGLYLVEGIRDNEVYRSMELWGSYLIFGWAIPGRRGDCIFYSKASGLSYRQLKGDFHETDALDFETGRIFSIGQLLHLRNLQPHVWIELNLCEMLE